MSTTRLDPLRAFPPSLERTVIPAIDSLGDDWWTSEDTIGPIHVNGELVEIPLRIHGADLVGAKTIGAKAKLVRACLLSRHKDGFVREAQLDRILELPNDWSIPFLVQLVGEYVVEIHEKLLSRVDAIPRGLIDDFAAANPQFVAKTKQRVISYWYCYHSDKVELDDLAACKLIDKFGWWQKRDLPVRQKKLKRRG